MFRLSHNTHSWCCVHNTGCSFSWTQAMLCLIACQMQAEKACDKAVATAGSMSCSRQERKEVRRKVRAPQVCLKAGGSLAGGALCLCVLGTLAWLHPTVVTNHCFRTGEPPCGAVLELPTFSASSLIYPVQPHDKKTLITPAPTCAIALASRVAVPPFSMEAVPSAVQGHQGCPSCTGRGSPCAVPNNRCGASPCFENAELPQAAPSPQLPQ